MKKLILFIFACLLFNFIGCKNPSGATVEQEDVQNEPQNEQTENNENNESDKSDSLFSKGNIYAVITKEDDEITKKEYLSFSTENRGDYYADSSFTPTSVFEFDESLNVIIVGKKPYYIISHKENLYWAEGYGVAKNGTSLVGEWNIGIATVTFNSDGTLRGSNTQGYTISGTYTNKDGLINCLITANKADDTVENENTVLFYTSEGRMYIDVQQLQKVSYVGEVPAEPEPIAPLTDADGVEYAVLSDINLSSGIYACNVYNSINSKTVSSKLYFDFSKKQLYKGSILTSSFSAESLNDNKLLKVTVSSDGYDDVYLLKLSDETVYGINASNFENIEKTGSADSFYGKHIIKNNGATLNLSFNKDGSINGTVDVSVSGISHHGELTGSFSVNKGLVTSVLTLLDGYDVYETIAATGIYYYDGEKPVFIFSAEEFYKAYGVGGKLYPTSEEALDLVNYVASDYELPAITSYEVGDIICEDGSVIRNQDEKYSIPFGKEPIAVIYKVSDNGKTGVGIGLKETTSRWAVEDSTGYKTFLSTRLNDGAGNWDIICASDPIGTAAADQNYPIFYWAEQYGINNYPASVYSDGWYIPGLGDFNQIYKNKELIDDILKVLDGSGLSNSYWTSCQYQDKNSNYYGIVFRYSDPPSDSIFSYAGTSTSMNKANSSKVRAVHKFYLD